MEINSSHMKNHLVGAGGLAGNTSTLVVDIVIPAGAVVNDVVNLVRVPAGSRFVDCQVVSDGLGTTTTLGLGYKAGRGADLVTKADYFAAGLALNAAARLDAAPAVLDSVEDIATITGTILTTDVAADTEITLILSYVSNGTA